jgi:outer membrane protein assembly factor BamB
MQLSSAFRGARLGCLAAVLSLTACGGGGGGDSSGSGAGTGSGAATAYLTVSPSQLNVTAIGNTSSSPTAAITVTVHNPSSSGTYVGAGFTKNAITAMTFTSSGAQATMILTFKDPSVLAPGSYSDSVQVAICTDSTCTKVQSGSQVTVPVRYTVTLNATVTLSADPTTTGAGVPTTLTWSSTHAQSCTAAGEWSGSLPSSGSQAVAPTTLGIHTYSISCGNPGAPAQASLTVTAVAPVLTLTAFPASVVLGKTATLRWQGQYASTCVASGAWSGSLPPTGFKTLSLTGQGTTNYHLVCSNSAASDQKDAAVTVVAAPVSPPATAYRMTEAHDGVLVTSNGVQFPPQSAPTWTKDLGAPVSYPLIANGMVFVATANPDGSYGNQLYALNAQTGATVWGPIAISGTYFGSGLTYDNGRVFLLMFDGGVHAFNAANGSALWTTQLPGYWYEASPNAYGGVVFITGNAGLSALDEISGAILWTAVTGGTTDWASPSVSSEGVYVQEGYSCNAGAYGPLPGTALWQSTSPCDTPWGYASVVKAGVFFGRVGASLNLFDAGTGTFKDQLGSARAPSVTDTALVALNAGILSSTRLSDLVQTWTFSGDGSLVTAPVVVNNTVFVGSGSGNVYGLDAGTGAQIWKGVSPVPINTDSENGGPMPPSGPAAGENLLIFVAGTSLVAWQLQ